VEQEKENKKKKVANKYTLWKDKEVLEVIFDKRLPKITVKWILSFWKLPTESVS
jgi:hypothetical protein